MKQEMQAVRQIINTNPFIKLLQVEVTEMQPGTGQACLAVNVSAKHLNPQGTLHGGVVASLCDIAMGAALRTLGKVGVTVNLQTNFLAPGYLGDRVMARGTVVHDGNTMVATEATVSCGETILAKATGLWLLSNKTALNLTGQRLVPEMGNR
ncbi:PaaI family thioesterase [Desulforamulus hydrothermalis]|uniref:Thioesterase superfamily protein n=1 Tax=Desulforamulus hydrothermalis Lam5 = DSM 18033 TaxID=1121428 RepID=K8EAK8_9FIRM|nr:PaaI family thioesterase [Desulforamulus hydrothermalis]CCO08668.1 Thioesterase superfamily protein [Desulforamulus hydrothermalis Lam5 = DSM 18033]SHH38966.1 acyl-CoA thioesterase [Desulforamulus hydrothermalis Lam5 = DSM 18033]